MALVTHNAGHQYMRHECLIKYCAAILANVLDLAKYWREKNQLVNIQVPNYKTIYLNKQEEDVARSPSYKLNLKVDVSYYELLFSSLVLVTCFPFIYSSLIQDSEKSSNVKLCLNNRKIASIQNVPQNMLKGNQGKILPAPHHQGNLQMKTKG